MNQKAKDADGYWYSKDWSKIKQTPEDTDLEYIPLFDTEKPTGRQIFVSKEYRPDLDAYPLPDYVASTVYAEVDVDCRIGHMEEMIAIYDENLQPSHIYPEQWRQQYLEKKEQTA